MTPTQLAFNAYCAHTCEVCDARPTWDSPRCEEGTRLFEAWRSFTQTQRRLL